MRRSDIGVGCRIWVKSGRTLLRQSGPLTASWLTSTSIDGMSVSAKTGSHRSLRQNTEQRFRLL